MMEFILVCSLAWGVFTIKDPWVVKEIRVDRMQVVVKMVSEGKEFIEVPKGCSVEQLHWEKK